MLIRQSDFADVRRITASGQKALLKSVSRAARSLIARAPEPACDWMEANLYMPPEMTDRPGPLKLNKLQRGIFSAPQEKGAKWITYQKPPRSGATTGAAGISMYYSAHEGEDTFYTERAEDYAQVFYKKFIFPLLTGSKNIAHLKRADGKSGRQDTWQNTILTTGAAIQLRSAATDGAFRQLKARLIILDECSAAAYRAGKSDSEGDKTSLAWKRGQQFRNPIMFLLSTPTEEGVCIVSREYKRSDQRVYDVPCPHCGVYQPLLPNVGPDKAGPGLKYRCDPVSGEIEHYEDDNGDILPDIWYECMACGDPIRESSMPDMIEAGSWRATAIPAEPGLIGFYSWAIHSSDPQSTWLDIVRQHRASLADPSMRQPFKNLVLALPWERVEQKLVPVNELKERARPWPTSCPEFVRFLTAGIDNQKGREDGSQKPRSEITIVGWGFGEECAILAHIVVEEIPFTSESATKIYEVLDRAYYTPSGRALRVEATGCDVGYDYDHGMEFCHRPESRQAPRRIVALKGMNTTEFRATLGAAPVKSRKNALHTFLPVYKQQPTEILLDNLRIKGSGPRAIHFPASLPESYYESLTAFHKVNDKAKNRSYYVDEPDNEALDCWVYAYWRMKDLCRNRRDFHRMIVENPGEKTNRLDLADESASAEIYKGPDRSALSDLALAEAPAATQSRAPSVTADIPSSVIDELARMGRGKAPTPTLPVNRQTWSTFGTAGNPRRF